MNERRLGFVQGIALARDPREHGPKDNIAALQGECCSREASALLPTETVCEQHVFCRLVGSGRERPMGLGEALVAIYACTRPYPPSILRICDGLRRIMYGFFQPNIAVTRPEPLTRPWERSSRPTCWRGVDIADLE